jgi:uncharacterized protein
MVLNCLFVAETEKMGKGVFTKTSIDADEIIEIAEVIVLSADDKVLLNKTKLKDYIFDWGPQHDLAAMALGNVPIYNHSSKANCDYIMDFDSNVIIIKTVREIAAGEELFINYVGNWNEDKPVWFETA